MHMHENRDRIDYCMCCQNCREQANCEQLLTSGYVGKRRLRMFFCKNVPIRNSTTFFLNLMKCSFSANK